MGLDMYLHKRTWIGNEIRDPQNQITLTAQSPEAIPTHIKPERIQYVIEKIACWRKANAIHQWFVQNVQCGNDDCHEYSVQIEQLKELRKIVRRIIKDPPRGPNELPTQSGFFFGDVDYGENYMNDLEYTNKILTTIINEIETTHDVEIVYQSSW